MRTLRTTTLLLATSALFTSAAFAQSTPGTSPDPDTAGSATPQGMDPDPRIDPDPDLVEGDDAYDDRLFPSTTVPAEPMAPPATTEVRPLEDLDDLDDIDNVDEVDARSTPRWRQTLQNVGASVQVGAGGGGFIGEQLRDLTATGPTWDVRAAFGANQVIGIEAAYIGSAQATNGAGLDPGATLVSAGTEGAIRLTAPIRGGEGRVDVRPFAFGGLGWQRYTFFGENGSLPSNVENADNLMTVPAGVGLELGLGNVTLGGRVAYRHTFFGELLGDSDDGFFDDDALHQWNAGANLGVEF